MEKTWEFTVVSKGFFERDLSKRDWSSRHVRLKFQMVAACLFVWLVKNFEISEIHLIFVKFKDITPPSDLTFIAQVFAFFSIVSFISRSLYEAPSTGEMEPSHYELIRDNHKLIKEWKSRADEFVKKPLLGYISRGNFISEGDMQLRIDPDDDQKEIRLTMREANFADMLLSATSEMSDSASALDEFEEDLRPSRTVHRACKRLFNMRKNFLRAIRDNTSLKQSAAKHYCKHTHEIIAEAELNLFGYKFSHWIRLGVGGIDLWVFSFLFPLGFSIFLFYT